MKTCRDMAGQLLADNFGRPNDSLNRAALTIESPMEDQTEARKQKAISLALVAGTLLSLASSSLGISDKNIPKTTSQ